MAMGTSRHHPLRGGAGELPSHRASDNSGWHDSGIGEPNYEHIPPPPPPLVVQYYSSSSRSRGSFGSLGLVPEGPEEGGALPVVPARSPRRLSLGDGGAGTGAVAGLGAEGEGWRRGSGGGVASGTAALPLSPPSPAFGLSRFGDAHAGYPVTSKRVGQEGYAGLRDPFSNEHAYIEDYDPSYGSAGGYDGGVHDGGGGWYAHQAPASEWSLRNEVGGQLGRKGRPL